MPNTKLWAVSNSENDDCSVGAGASAEGGLAPGMSRMVGPEPDRGRNTDEVDDGCMDDGSVDGVNKLSLQSDWEWEGWMEQ